MKRAYLSVWGKKGIAELAYGLKAAGYELYAGGSTAKILSQAELEINESGVEYSIAQIINVLELDAQTPEGAREIEKLDMPRPDLVVCNLHPISEITAQEGFSAEELPQYLDVWNTALLRVAARAWNDTAVLCDFSDYAMTLSALKDMGEVPLKRRRQLAVKALMYCAYYDACAAQFLAERGADILADDMVLALKKTSELAYGENPHQSAALYTLAGARPWGITRSRGIHGKPLRYNHFVDLDRAWECVCEIGAAAHTACVIVKHGIICGAACAQTTAEAFRFAYDANRQGAQGATVVFNRRPDVKAAQLLADERFELVAAPDFENAALDILRSSKENRLVLIPSTLGAAGETDAEPAHPEVPTQKKPSPEEEASMLFAMAVAKHSPSCATVIAQGLRTAAIASGQTSVHESLHAAIAKSRERHPIMDPARPLALACDTALTLNCIKEAAKAGIACIIQPGGASDDAASAAFCDEHGMTMALTGLRHLRH